MKQLILILSLFVGTSLMAQQQRGNISNLNVSNLNRNYNVINTTPNNLSNGNVFNRSNEPVQIQTRGSRGGGPNMAASIRGGISRGGAPVIVQSNRGSRGNTNPRVRSRGNNRNSNPAPARNINKVQVVNNDLEININEVQSNDANFNNSDIQLAFDNIIEPQQTNEIEFENNWSQAVSIQQEVKQEESRGNNSNPEAKDVEAPSINLPSIELPSINMPKISLPKVDLGEVAIFKSLKVRKGTFKKKLCQVKSWIRNRFARRRKFKFSCECFLF